MSQETTEESQMAELSKHADSERDAIESTGKFLAEIAESPNKDDVLAFLSKQVEEMNKEQAERTLPFKQMAESLYAKRYNGNSFQSHRIDSLIEQYLLLMLPDFIQFFEDIWALQEKEDQWYGDMDWSFIKYKGAYIEDDGKEDSGRPIRAILLKNHASLGEFTNFLIIKQDGYFPKFHVRIVGEKKSGYDKPKTIAWYKKRKFSLDYVERFHRGDLGGSYGDCRDNGYMLTADRMFGDAWKIDRAILSTFTLLTECVIPYFEIAVQEIKEQLEDSNSANAGNTPTA